MKDENSTYQNEEEVSEEINSILETAENISSDQKESDWEVGKSLVQQII